MAPPRYLPPWELRRQAAMSRRNPNGSPFQRPERPARPTQLDPWSEPQEVSPEIPVELSDFEVLEDGQAADYPSTASGSGLRFSRIDFVSSRIITPPNPVPIEPRAIHHGRLSTPIPPTEVTVDFENTTSTRSRSVSRPPGYWKMRNGNFIAISDMDARHLDNTILLCERNALNRGRRLGEDTTGVYQELTREKSRRIHQRQLDQLDQLRQAQRQQFLNSISPNGRRLFGVMTRPAVTETGIHAIDESLQSSPIIPEDSQSPSVIPEGKAKRRIRS